MSWTSDAKVLCQYDLRGIVRYDGHVTSGIGKHPLP